MTKKKLQPPKVAAGVTLVFLVSNLIGFLFIWSSAKDASYWNYQYNWVPPLFYNALIAVVICICALLITFIAKDWD